jgi:hypothetical protein
MTKTFFLIFAVILLCLSCHKKAEQKAEFLEVRITRQTALEGGETLVLRKINDEWSALLLGDGYRFSCLYQKAVQPKSGWENFWRELQSKGLLEISDGRRLSSPIDGNRFKAEINYQNNVKQYLFENPQDLKTKESEQIQNIGNLISREFETPMFFADYDRGAVGDYLTEQCKNYHSQDSIR